LAARIMAEAGLGVHVAGGRFGAGVGVWRFSAMDRRGRAGGECIPPPHYRRRGRGGVEEATMKRLLVGVLLTTTGVALGAGRASALSAGECAGLSIRVKDLPEATSAQCGSENFGGGGDRGSGIDEFIQIIGAESMFVVSHAAAGTRTYLKRLGVKDVIANYSIFESTDNWGDETESDDFAVRRFNAKLAGSGSQVVCFGFVHFAGHVARSTGYRHLISGYSCNFTSVPPTDSRIDKLVGSIDFDFE
jgi:hypothetical protein